MKLKQYRGNMIYLISIPNKKGYCDIDKDMADDHIARGGSVIKFCWSVSEQRYMSIPY